ncbi:MAG: isoleucine--tRNA ligase [Phycisphaeraceae bacterium]|nr:isoleucine--tRNA ligase [Phycisphaeraceae bacterium]
MNDAAPSKRSFKDSLNLPKTAFAMKANLVQNEPASLQRWQKRNLYARTRQARQGSPKYVFHDGPPYANGSIHLGHLLNKALKDFVVRCRTMAGYDCAYTPGWDCHGLPIEHKVMQEEKGSASLSDVMGVRRKCRSYAEKFMKLQAKQMQRLLTLADYDDPYFTMDPKFEAGVLEVFADLVSAGLVYRALKPVHWSIENRTALADAELEYYDRQDISVYVMFDVISSDVLPSGGGGKPVSLMIWTTTPWTLPANLAVAVHERHEYGLYDLGDRLAVLACELAPKVLKNPSAPLKTFPGKALLGTQYQHPFIDRQSPVLSAEYVTLEDGTGLVHTAPGHGVEDYQTALREGVDIYCPVREDGTFDDTAPNWLRGKLVWDANKLVVEHLRQSGHLHHDHLFTHSYPHDWRGKTPTIFRATEQWFISVDKAYEAPRLGRAASLRQRALDVTAKDVNFIPEWGRNRMRGMLESRPDWCISRQRAWGLPIPAFVTDDGQALLTKASVTAIVNIVRDKGSDSWFRMTPAELLAGYDLAGDADAPKGFDLANCRKSSDIFDVWFESGSSWHACMRQRGQAQGDAAKAHTDLYLEGSDQHRGWFQLSLLPSLGATGKSPFASVLTHGFMVDKDGRKMSKSLGNTLEVDELLKEFGADVCRWWVATLNVENDIKVDRGFFQVAGEEYRKIRNTLRYLLGSLSDFSPAHCVDMNPVSLDAWAMGELAAMSRTVTQAYEKLDFRRASEVLFDFCNTTMSAVYLMAAKDRLYCDAASSPRRRQTQTTMHAITSTLIKLLAPILPHTADEAWRALTSDDNACVHLETFNSLDDVKSDARWAAVLSRRDAWMKALEQARQSRGLDNPLDMGLHVPAEDDLKAFDPVDLADLCGVSRFALVDGASQVEVDDLRNEPRCERSWKRDGTVKPRKDQDGCEVLLSDRDAQAVGM